MYLYRFGLNCFKFFFDVLKILFIYVLLIMEVFFRYFKCLLKYSILVFLVKKRYFLDDRLVFFFYYSVEVYGNYD